MRRPLDAILVKRKKTLLSAVTTKQKEGQSGRPPALDPGELRQRRDRLQGIFAAHWPVVGWNLQRARKPLHVTDALRLLARLNHPTIELLLMDSFKKSMPDGFREFRQERKRLHSQLGEAQKRLNEANTKVLEARSAFEQALNWFAIARDGYKLARKQKKPTAPFRQEREKWLRRCESMQAELTRREKTLIECTEKIGRIENEIKEIEAHFAQAELLRFVLSERYVFTPLNFANAAAGLPDMGWRRSFLLCSRLECSAKTSINYQILEAVRMALEGAPPTSADGAVIEIRRHINKGRQFESVREYLDGRWSTLEGAVLTGWSSGVHANARPYEITSRFLAALSAPKSVTNPLFDALAEDLP